MHHAGFSALAELLVSNYCRRKESLHIIAHISVIIGILHKTDVS